MRSAVLLVGGFVLLATGVGVMALGVPGRWVLGPVLVVIGVVLKMIGVLRDAQPQVVPGGRTKTTLGTAPAAQGTPSSGGESPAARRARQTGQVSRR